MNEYASLGVMLAAVGEPSTLRMIWAGVQIFAGFSFIIFVHELGHFLVAKWAGVRVEQFAIGFFREIFGFTRGETRYSFNLLPLGGYVKMLGQEDFEVDTTGELQYKDDPRSFANKPVGHRMAIVSAGVIMNLLLAGLLFMIVFLVGKMVSAPRVGAVMPDSPAALAGLQTGDVIKEIDGTEVDEFFDINMAVQLAKPGKPLTIVVDRGGKQQTFLLEPERTAEGNLLQIGITSPQSATIVGVGPEYPPSDPHNPHIGDKVVEMAGKEVTEQNANEMMNLLLTDPLGTSDVVVERSTDPTREDAPVERVPVTLRPRMGLFRAEVAKEPENLLGLVPLVQISEVTKGGRADLAGIEVGDVILSWDGIKYPTNKQITENIVASAPKTDPHPEKDIPVRVRRATTGDIENLVVRPKVKIIPITGKRLKPTINAKLDMFADNMLLVGSVVETVAGRPTPAAAAGIPAGAMITRVNDTPVSHWIDLAEQLRRHAGTDVTLTYDHAGQRDLSASMHVPQTVRTVLGLGPEAIIVSVDGQKRVYVDREGHEVDEKGNAAADDEERRAVPTTVGHPIGLRAVLAKHVGQTVEIEYRRHVLAELEKAEVTITDEMLDPWVGTLRYTIHVITGGEMTLLRKSNPFAALREGAQKTYYFVVQVYQVMERMIIQRSLGVEHISGPVGIVKLGGAMAEKGFTDLLYFLAMISANLAVINFLPLPIVDGGLMVFLIIEKIKGSPISMRVQVATQVVGLVLIVTAFLFVTIQDLWR